MERAVLCLWVACVAGACLAPQSGAPKAVVSSAASQSPVNAAELAPCDPDRCEAYAECVRDARTGACRPAGEDDCLLATVLCEQMGACGFKAGSCRVLASVDAECNVPRGQMGINWCQIYGTCQSAEGLCTAKTDQDCQGAAACQDKGLCKAQGGWCVAGGAAQQMEHGRNERK